MAGKKSINVEEVQEPTEDDYEDDKEDQIEEDMDFQKEMMELEGQPMPDESHSSHSIMHQAMFKEDNTIRTTFLTEPELGRPLFSVRFLLDLHKHAVHHKLERVEAYYRNKVQNITHSGLSNKGFGLHMTVTQKRDTTRKRVREPETEEKGGRQDAR